MFHLIVLVYKFMTAMVTKMFDNEYHYSVSLQVIEEVNKLCVQRHSLHKEKECVPPIFFMKAMKAVFEMELHNISRSQ